MSNNVALTGVPRSGMMLVCYLLNTLPNIVALHEPLDVDAIFQKGATLQGVHSAILTNFGQIRAQILKYKTAPSYQIDGQIPDNSFSSFLNNNGLRQEIADFGTVAIEKPLAEDFCLVIKQPSAFTAVLEILSLPTIAIIRNPLAVLASWNSVDTYHHLGHSPTAELLHAELREELAWTTDLHQKQLILLNCITRVTGNSCLETEF